MQLVKVGGATYNLGLLVKFVEHRGQREVGAGGDPLAPEPIFGDFRYVELVFLDGSRVVLDGPQTEAFLAGVSPGRPPLDLDRVEADLLGRPLVRDARDGDVIVPPEALAEAGGGEY